MQFFKGQKIKHFPTGISMLGLSLKNLGFLCLASLALNFLLGFLASNSLCSISLGKTFLASSLVVLR